MTKKILIPFHRGQKVRIGTPLNGDSILDYNCEAIVQECNNDLYFPEYSLMTLDGGGGAWYPHEILILVEETNEKNLLFLEELLNYEWE